MIWGKSANEREDARQAKLAKLYRRRVRRFCWLPRHTNQYRWVWLQYAWFDYGVYEYGGRFPYRKNDRGPIVYIHEKGDE